MTLEAIAIVGRGCVLPGALDPDIFWANIVSGRCSLAPVPDRYWSRPREQVLGRGADRAVTDVAGVVSGFGPSTRDPVFDWTLHAARAALRDAGRDGPQSRAGMIMGNLSYPTRGLVRYAEHVFDPVTSAVDPRNRFCSGYPVLLAARELGLGGDAFAVDAACASALYAVKLACDRLHDGTADLMLAGGVNASDMMFLHVGFSALGALSRSGRSRPFHRDADGLIPGEGAVCFALMRLSDATTERRPVHGVIRGIGLSNDGRTGGFLAPARAAQVVAMRSAYARAGLDPRTVSLVECHAAGTPAGDATEIASLAEVFAETTDVPVGSVKSNVGHLLTAAGGVGLLKLLGALAAGIRPATLGATEPREDLAGTPLRPLQQNEEWTGRRRAAVSAFGFGGCNAHLIVDAYEPRTTTIAVPNTSPLAPPPPVEVAVVAVRATVGRADLETALLAGETARNARAAVHVALTGLRFPPADLPDMLAQQSLLLQVARDAVADVALQPDRTMVLVGMGCDPEVARYHLRWQGYRNVVPELTAAGVIGRMPNIVANRINVQLDLTGPSFTVSAEEASGVVALRLAASSIRAGEADAAVVGAVDLSHEPVHQASLRGVGIDRPPGDAAVVLVLKRLSEARRDGDAVMAILDAGEDVEADLTVGNGSAGAIDPTDWFGSPHAASGLLAVATAVLALHHRALPRRGAPAEARPGLRLAEVVVSALATMPIRIRLAVGDAAPSGRPTQPLGPYVELLAHPALVANILNNSGRTPMASERQNTQAMPRAPTLAKVGANAPHPEPEAADNLAVWSRSSPERAIMTGQERVAELHRAFMVRQSDLHQRYLQLNGRMLSELTLGRISPGPHPAPAPAPAPSQPSGPRFGRDQLLIHARGTISELFGPQFAAQDLYSRQTRLPEPPLLLVDRVLALDAVAASMGAGTIRTQTDVSLGAWYLDPCGRMAAGALVEAGQADLMLISWLGVDLINRGERVYRLLGCEVTFHGGLPQPGDTLDYTIGVDGYQEHNGVRLFSFHSDCTIAGEAKLTVRNGQAGFFTDAELAASKGVSWDPAAEAARDDGPVDPPVVLCPNDRFDAPCLEAFVEGRPAECFGDPWKATWAHVRTPRNGSGRLRLLDEVTEFNPTGGPWGRGYLCARRGVTPEDWFFAGHFHNDPCMPGTLMLEACVQAMAFYLAAMGCTIDRDGWRFEPVPEQPYVLRCRGQVTPSAKLLTYEVFVSGFSAGPRPTLYADVLATVDGVPAFHARRLVVRLRPDVPLNHWRFLGRPAVQRSDESEPLPSLGGLVGYVEDPAAAVVDGFRLDYRAMLGCAWGRAEDAFGPTFWNADETRKCPRLPGPPYLFMSRISQVDKLPKDLRTGATMTAEYDVPDEAWFFETEAGVGMPLAALVEAAMQPCGSLSTYLGSVSESEPDLFFRNLGGDFEVTGHVPPGVGVLRTRVQLRTSTRFASYIVQSFGVECHADGVAILSGEATFGWFPKSALSEQVGIPPTETEQSALTAPSEFLVALRDRPDRFFGGPLRLPGPMLLMLDRITGFWPLGGAAGLGRIRAELDIDPNAWYFKAHFYGDPVQPGSLGLDAICQVLRFYCIETGVGAGVPHPTFEPVMPGRAAWQFRGQILPTDHRVTIEVEVLEVADDFVRAQAWLWVDGRRIYHVTTLGIRVVSGEDTNPAFVEHTLDTAVATWLGDHRPTWTIPALPMMSTVDLLAGAAFQLTGQTVTILSDVQLLRWLPIPKPIRLRSRAQRRANTVAVSLQLWREAGRLSRFELAATATVDRGALPSRPTPFEPLVDAVPIPDMYESGEMFHGPAFQYLTELRMGSKGSTGTLDVSVGCVPRGHLHQGLLDAATHAVPHMSLWRWAGNAAGDRVGFPHRIPTLTLFEPLPDEGELRVEARFLGFDGADHRFPSFDVQLCRDDRVVVALRLVDILVPIGRFARVAPRQCRAFVRDHIYVEEMLPGTTEGRATVLSQQDMTVVSLWWGWFGSGSRLPTTAQLTEQLAQVAVTVHISRATKVHPIRIVVAADLASGWVDDRPDEVHRVSVTEYPGRVMVTDR